MTEVESFHQSLTEVKSEKDAFLLDKALKELKDLRSQLHYAADYCESSFLKSKQKYQVVENTKEYIYRAVITVVDHLGSASANLDKIISLDKTIPETEHRLDSLSQRVMACKEFSNKSALADLCRNPRLPRHCSRYTFTGNVLVNNDEAKVKISGDLKNEKDSSEFKSGIVVQKRLEVQNTGFEFQKKTRKPHRTKVIRVSFRRGSELLSLIRGTTRKSRS